MLLRRRKGIQPLFSFLAGLPAMEKRYSFHRCRRSAPQTRRNTASGAGLLRPRTLGGRPGEKREARFLTDGLGAVATCTQSLWGSMLPSQSLAPPLSRQCQSNCFNPSDVSWCMEAFEASAGPLPSLPTCHRPPGTAEPQPTASLCSSVSTTPCTKHSLRHAA